MNDALGGVQTVLVLGGASELAVATLVAMDLRPDAKVVLAGRSMPALREADEKLPCPCVLMEWDAKDATGHASFVEKVVAEVGDLDLVLVTAGILGEQERAETDPAHAVDILETNFVGLVPAMFAIARQLRRQGHGVMAVFSSVAGLRGRRANFVYGASKAGLDVFTEGLAASLEGSGARVLTVRPGFVYGRMTEGRPAAKFATHGHSVGTAVADALKAGRSEVVHVPRALGPVFTVLRLLPRSIFRRLPG
jgi:decaprenylphospho-beta-D-erythro-pentofuranosid-2-ulose 2-reductase